MSLSAPVVVQGPTGTFSWETVEGATGYDCYVGRCKQTTVTGPSWTLVPPYKIISANGTTGTSNVKAPVTVVARNSTEKSTESVPCGYLGWTF